MELIDRAAKSSPKRARRLHRTARRLLKQAAAKAIGASKARRPKLAGECAKAISTAALQVVAALNRP